MPTLLGKTNGADDSGLDNDTEMLTSEKLLWCSKSYWWRKNLSEIEKYLWEKLCPRMWRFWVPERYDGYHGHP